MLKTVRDESILWVVEKGEHENKICRVLQYSFANTNVDSVADVIFVEPFQTENATIMARDLSPIDPPGWPLTESEYKRRCAFAYGLKEYFEKERSLGSNLLRTDRFAQPRALRIGDVLATGETVEKIRRGYNDSVIAHLDRSGWVELAPRLPIALLRNENSLLPARLVEKDELATGCLISQNATTTALKDNWVNIYLYCDSKGIAIPSCIPLALA